MLSAMTNISRWLDVEVGTGEISLHTVPSNIALVDLSNDNDCKLFVGDLGKEGEYPKLKIFKGAMQVSDISLPDFPLAVVSFYASETMPKAPPLIAVAFDSAVYVYRNLKFFYKYQIHTPDISESEVEIWKKLIDPSNHNEQTVTELSKNLHSLSHELCNQSRSFLQLTIDEKLEYLEEADLPKKALIQIACMTTIKMTSNDKYAVSSLIIGTEEGDIIVINPHTFTQLMKVQINVVKTTPFQIVTTGMFNVDYRITVATRQKSVCLLKREWREGKQLFRTDDHIVAIEVLTFDSSILVICCDKTFACYSKKGKKLWWLSLEQRPVALCLVPVFHLGVTLAAVAMSSGHLYLYDGKSKRDSLFIRDVVSAMKFGQLGKEEHVFTIVTTTGNLMLKILKRTVDFSAHAAGVDSPTPAGQRPWLIPKKSKLFLEQSMRERENAKAMHETFQYELDRLRLMAAKTLLESYTKSDNAMALGLLEPVRLSAEVQGLGPVFKMTLIIENTSKDKAVAGLAILFHTSGTSYKVATPYIKIPLLTPGSKLKFPTKLEEIFDDNINPEVFFRTVTGRAEGSLVKVVLLKDGKPIPVLAATVQMPPTDPMMIPFDRIQTNSDFK